MKKLIILSVLLAGLAAGAYFLINKGEEAKDTFKDKVHTQFALEDINQIHKVDIKDWSGDHAELKKTDQGWMYTNKVSGETFRARPQVVQTLLETMGKIRTRQAVNKKAIPNVMKSMRGKSRAVTIKNKSGKILRQYYVGSGSPDSDGTYMVMEGSEKPYIVYFPSWVGTLDTRYVVDEQIWRDKAVMRITPKQIKFFQVKYQQAGSEVHSFNIKNNDGNLIVLDYQDQAPNKVLSEDNLATYLDELKSIGAEKIIYDKAIRDETIVAEPFAVINYQTKQMVEPQSLRVYPIYNPTADRGDGRRGTRQQINRYYIDGGESHFYLMQEQNIQKLFWKYGEFFKVES